GLSGHVNVRGNRVTFNSAVSDLRANLDSTLGLHFEASRGLWSLLLDPDYVKITQHPALGGTNTSTTYETSISDAGAYYKLYSIPMIPRRDYSCASFELLGAGRILSFHTVIDFLTTSIPSSVSDTTSVIVPIIGARFRYHFNSKLDSWLSGDFGGFQVSHVSSTWSALLGLRYHFTPFFDLSLAYKVFSVNYSIQAVTINTFLQGPVLGLGFSW
ncbi:MAG TPA: hypothetical protein VLH77_00445, partial [Gammaproteobacteria bacterium]|nr:hypothetical protein [Gammaproteobacteria bacterium]